MGPAVSVKNASQRRRTISNETLQKSNDFALAEGQNVELESLLLFLILFHRAGGNASCGPDVTDRTATRHLLSLALEMRLLGERGA
jgi:hypothetical protein